MDRISFETALLKAQPALWRWCLKLAKGDYANACDIFQCTQLAALEGCERCKPEFLQTWIFKIARVKAAMFHKEINRSAELSDSATSVMVEPEFEVEVENSLVYYKGTRKLKRANARQQASPIRVRKVNKILPSLPERMQFFIKLHQEGKKYKEIAEISNLSLISVKIIMSQAKQAVKARLNYIN